MHTLRPALSITPAVATITSDSPVRGPFPFSLVNFATTLSLFFSCTNYVPVAALMPALGLLLLPITIPLVHTRDWRLFTILITVVYFLVAAATYDFFSLLDPNFYRRDGNFFVSFGGLLALLIFGRPCDAERLSIRFIFFVVIIYSTFFTFWFITGYTLRPEWQLTQYRDFNPLFYANNACGGFLAIMCAVTIGIAASRRSLFLSLTSALLFIFCFFTASRGSILGLAFGIVATLILNSTTRVLAPSLLVLSLALLSFITGLAMAFATNFDVSITEENARLILYLDEGFFDEKTANVLIRTHILFPLAVSLASESPIFGLGFGSFDDRPYNIVTIINGLIALNRPNEILHTDSHAHNTFLHVFAELGVIGLILITAFFAAIINLTKSVPQQGLRLGLMIAFWSLLGSSLTEHRAFTPSNALPIVLLLGMALGGRYGVDLRATHRRSLAYRRSS